MLGLLAAVLVLVDRIKEQFMQRPFFLCSEFIIVYNSLGMESHTYNAHIQFTLGCVLLWRINCHYGVQTL
jgi:hypothetical protein